MIGSKRFTSKKGGLMMIHEQWWYVPLLMFLMVMAYGPMLYRSFRAMLKWADTYSDYLVAKIERKLTKNDENTSESH